jgi:hypothetical protein
VMAHQDGTGPAAPESLGDPAPERVVTDQWGRSHRVSPLNSSPIMVSTHGIGLPRAAHAVAYVEWAALSDDGSTRPPYRGPLSQNETRKRAYARGQFSTPHAASRGAFR